MEIISLILKHGQSSTKFGVSDTHIELSALTNLKEALFGNLLLEFFSYRTKRILLDLVSGSKPTTNGRLIDATHDLADLDV